MKFGILNSLALLLVLSRAVGLTIKLFWQRDQIDIYYQFGSDGLSLPRLQRQGSLRLNRNNLSH